MTTNVLAILNESKLSATSGGQEVHTNSKYANIIFSLLTILLSFFAFTGFATTYYNVANSATLQSTAQWGTNTNGTGSHPGNFTTSGDVFDIYNGTANSIGAAWTLGAVTINIGNGSAAMSFTQPNYTMTATATVNVTASGTYTINNATTPALGTLDPASTVVYTGAASYTIPAITFGSLTVSTTGNVSFSGGTTIVAGSYNQTSGTVVLNSGSVLVNLNVLGSCTISGGSMDFNSTTTSVGYGYLNVAQNLTLSGTAVLETTGIGGQNGILNFNGSGTSSSPQIFTVSNGGALPWTNITIAAGTYVQLAGTSSTITLNGWTPGSPDWRGTVIVNGTLDTKTTSFAATAANCVFNLNSGATLITANTNGLGGASNGVVQSTNWNQLIQQRRELYF